MNTTLLARMSMTNWQIRNLPYYQQGRYPLQGGYIDGNFYYW